MVNQSVIESIKRYFCNLKKNGISASFGVIFGSQVNGRANEWSDIDLIVVSPFFDKQINREDINKLWRIAARTDSRIEPFPCGEKQWKEDTSSAIIEIARNEGEYLDWEDKD